MSRRTMSLVGLAAGVLLLAACSNSSSNETTTTGAPSGGDSEVSIENFAFGPDDITVSVGDTIARRVAIDGYRRERRHALQSRSCPQMRGTFSQAHLLPRM
ncbi:MAG: hypothetical protein QGD95_09795, partial [Actinomycetota bacterium]|nr:hypothetical protein [Actinomycetota bacterium]